MCANVNAENTYNIVKGSTGNRPPHNDNTIVVDW